MANVSTYVKESWEELTQKVTWPTWRELQSSAILVLIASMIIALVIYAMDQGIYFALDKFYRSLA